MLREMIRMAKAHGVAVGAHPGYPDLVGFGRRAMDGVAEGGRGLRASTRSRRWPASRRPRACASSTSSAHGELFNVAAQNRELAMAIAAAVAAFDPSLILFGAAGSRRCCTPAGPSDCAP